MTVKKILFIIPVCMFVFLGCEKNDLKVSALEIPENAAYIKIAYLSNPVKNQSVQVKLNGTRVSGLINYATAFPGGGTNIQGTNATDYLPIKSGSNTITFSVPNVNTDKDSILLYTTTVNIPEKETHTLFVVDTFPNISSFLLKDEQVRPDSGKIKLRFVHAIPNVAAVDVYTNATLLASNIAYKSATPYLTAPSITSDTIKVRTAGAATTVAPIATFTFSNSNQKVYTFLSRGYSLPTGSPATRTPTVSRIITW